MQIQFQVCLVLSIDDTSISQSLKLPKNTTMYLVRSICRFCGFLDTFGLPRVQCLCHRLLGWGRIQSNSNALAPRLKQASAPVASHSECQRKNGGIVHESSMVCVGGKGSSVCNGDSGGPLSCLEDGHWVVRGAASWVTSRTCPGNTYSVYSRVSSYVNWINGYIQSKLSSENSKRIERYERNTRKNILSLNVNLHNINLLAF